MHGATFLMAFGLAEAALAQYTVADNYTGENFFSMFNYFTGPDPTNGFVNYVDSGAASSSNLTSVNAQGQAYIGVDSTTTLSATGVGRNSIRLASNAAYTHYLAVIDLAHMPGGVCGTWPAFWSFGSGGSGWPSEGEIDIIEGANDQTIDYMTLHTSPNCSISSTSSDSILQPATTDCNTAVDGNTGCSFHATDPTTYGEGFNAAGGGVYATEWTSTGISIWHWTRGAAPADVLSASPSPASWGTPNAQWSGSSCDWDSHFMTHNLIFDTTFCGSWAGASTSFASCAASTGAATCEDFVATNPAAFAEAYWLVNSLVVYTNTDDSGSGSATSSGSPSTSTATTTSAPSAFPSASIPGSASTTPSASPSAASSSSIFSSSTSTSTSATTTSSSAAASPSTSSPAQNVRVSQNGAVRENAKNPNSKRHSGKGKHGPMLASRMKMGERRMRRRQF